MYLAYTEGSTYSDYINKNMVQRVNEEGGSIPAVVIITNTNFVYWLTKRNTRPQVVKISSILAFDLALHYFHEVKNLRFKTVYIFAHLQIACRGCCMVFPVQELITVRGGGEPKVGLCSYSIVCSTANFQGCSKSPQTWKFAQTNSYNTLP